MKTKWTTLLALCAALAAVSARAQGSAPAAGGPAAGAPAAGKKGGACKTEAQSLCKDVKPGHGRIVHCLVGKIDQIQDADCKAHAQKVKDHEDAVKQACSSEIGADCKGMDFSTGLWMCLRKNRKTLSDGCKASFKPAGKTAGGTGGTGGATANSDTGENEN